MKMRMMLLATILTAAGSAPMAEAPSAPPPPPLQTPEIQAAVEKGIKYIADKQGGDGFWRTPSCPIVMSCMAGLALASYEPSRGGPYWETLDRLVQGLLEIQEPSGFFRRAREGDRPAFGQAFAVLFLSQMYGMMDPETNDKVAEALKKGVDYIVAKQSRDGSWYQNYVSGHNDLVTIYHVLALRAAQHCGYIVPRESIDAAIKFINTFGLQFGSPGRTAACAATLLAAADYGNKSLPAILKQMRASIDYNLPSMSFPIFFHMNAALVMYFYGGAEWEEYYRKFGDKAVKLQRENGSWGPYKNVHWLQPDEIYTTANMITILQMPVESLPYWQYVKSDFKTWQGEGR